LGRQVFSRTSFITLLYRPGFPVFTLCFEAGRVFHIEDSQVCGKGRGRAPGQVHIEVVDKEKEFIKGQGHTFCE